MTVRMGESGRDVAISNFVSSSESLYLVVFTIYIAKKKVMWPPHETPVYVDVA
jgi:hypothetical protein